MPHDGPRWLKHFGWASFLGSTALHLAAVGILIFWVHGRDDVVILRYNAYLGVDLLGVWWQLFLVPAVTYCFVLINLVLMMLLDRRGYRPVALLLAFGNWLIAAAALVAAAALAFINV